MRNLLAIIFPPLAVLLCGKPIQAVLNCFLTLLLWIPGVVHAILVVNSHLADKRTDRLIRALLPAHEPLPREPLAFPKIHLPSLDWAMIFSRIRRSPDVIDRNIRIAWSMVEGAYSKMPDWAQPIVWGLGL